MIGDQLHMVVCIKQTSAASNVAPGTAGAKAAINPFDEYAIEEGVRLKERLNGKAYVVAMSMGAPEAVSVLREAIARGVDAGILLSAPEFNGSDAYATSYLLFKGIEKLTREKGPVDLILFGKQTNDSDTGQVGPATAAWLNIPNAAFVKKVADLQPGGPGKIVVHRMMEDGVDILEMQLPAAVSVVKEINEPRLPSLKGKMAAKKAEIPVWGPAQLNAESAYFGVAGSKLHLGVPYEPPPRSGGIKISGDTPQEKARNLLAKLREMKLV